MRSKTRSFNKLQLRRHAKRREWFSNRTDEDARLNLRAMELEGLFFADLTLQSPRVRKCLLRYEAQAEDGSWFWTEDDSGITLQDWIFTYRGFRSETFGDCNWRWHIIRIKRGLDAHEHESTLLHEMIHAYEGMLPSAYAEWLLLDLYRKVSKRLSTAKLNRFIDLSTHTVFHNATHGILFLLKSLDIDAKKGWPWGTTFAYGRADFFSAKRQPGP